jgi:hypothetical protein
MELNSMRNNGSNLDVASISRSLEESNLPLYQCLDLKSMWFLTLCGVNWSKRPYYLPIIWSVVVLLIASFFYVFYGPVRLVLDWIFELSYILFIDLGVTLQSIAAIFTVVHSRERLQQIVNKIDLFVFPESRRVALICLLVFYATYFPLLIYLTVHHYEMWDIYTLSLGLLASSALLSVNLLFLIVDAKVSMSLLTSLAEQDTITVEEYNLVKAEIDNRVSKNRTNNNIVMGVALASVIIIFLIFIISDNAASNQYIFVNTCPEKLYMLSLDFGLLPS